MNFPEIDLTPDAWSRVEELFEQAAAMDVGRQRDWLDGECGGDDLLRDYIVALLRAESSFNDTIEETIVATMTEAFGDRPDDSMSGEMIGPYRVSHLLGAGGMGVVYLAERADEHYDQQVAIKLGRHRLVDPQTELRLRNERQILANLDHPNIARLFDGGTTAEGVPYLVMEYIDGVRIDMYCDQHFLTVEQRLELFQTICGAVHYAHQNLVIHRDIKASNILVTDDGTPKLLDFGIAKLIDAQGTAQDGLTREGAVIMTPANAAPEQILGNPVTTATDIYALGLLLYRLLSGTPAHDSESLPPNEFARVVCLEPTPRPSAQLGQLASAASGDELTAQLLKDIGADRGTTVERLRRRLRGDLDTIILKALRKEPGRRYRSVSALADDIALHRRDLPILARAESWRYRAAKFVRRHYAAVTASALVAAMLVAFSILLTIQNRDIKKERDTAREVSQFLEDIFMAPDPTQAQGTSITAEELLASGASRIGRDLGGRPEIQATLMGTIGRVYFNLAAYERSVDMLEQALALETRASGEISPQVASLQNDLAEALIWLPDYPRAESLLESALSTNRQVHGEDAADVAGTLSNLAELHYRTGELDDARSFAEESISIYSATAGADRLELAEAKNLLARILQARGDLDRAEGLFLDAIDILTLSEGANHPYVAYYLQNLGVLQYSKGDLDAAAATLERAVEATRRILGENHHLLAATLRNQGSLLHAKGDLDEAEIVLNEALDLHAQTLGTDHPLVGYDMTALGMVLHDRGDLGAAENMLRRAVKIYDTAYDDDHQYTASALTELGAVLNSADRFAEAETTLQRALTIRRRDYRDDHEMVAGTQVEYADTLLQTGRLEEAGEILDASLAVLKDRPGRRHDRAVAVMGKLQRRLAGTTR